MRKAVFLCIHGQYVIHGSGLQAVLELSEQASERDGPARKQGVTCVTAEQQRQSGKTKQHGRVTNIVLLCFANRTRTRSMTMKASRTSFTNKRDLDWLPLLNQRRARRNWASASSGWRWRELDLGLAWLDRGGAMTKKFEPKFQRKVEQASRACRSSKPSEPSSKRSGV